MKDLVTIDRGALQDLISAIDIMAELLRHKSQDQTLEGITQDNEKLKYVNKLVKTSIQSFDKHNV